MTSLHEQQHEEVSIILFYKYHPLSNDFSVTERYRSALESLCRALDLKGRILVGCSKTEGLNGTLSGWHSHVLAFTYALLRDTTTTTAAISTTPHTAALEAFCSESKAFFDSIQEPELKFDSPSDFKWSAGASNPETPLFPDLNIKCTKELIGSGGVMLDIGVEETAQGYLTPQEWHEHLSQLQSNNKESKDDTVIIDCRNTKEYEIGHFPGALDPQTVTYSQFPSWVQAHESWLQSKKKVYMYCTGGIRCEKASAYVRRNLPPSAEVHHLKGGIHKYLEEYGAAGLWQGKNFVFDARQSSSAQETFCGKDGITKQEGNDKVMAAHTTDDHYDSEAADAGVVVGKCLYCQSPHDIFEAHTICAVCREPVLICFACQKHAQEFHCRAHFQLRHCYYSDLTVFTTCPPLQEQRSFLQEELQRIAVGKKWKQKRKTLTRQIVRVTQRLDELVAAAQTGDNINGGGGGISPSHDMHKCRSCGQVGCKGTCWGFYGIKRKEILEQQHQELEERPFHGLKRNEALKQPRTVQPTQIEKCLGETINNKSASEEGKDCKDMIRATAIAARLSKKPRRGVDADEIKMLQFHQPPSEFQRNVIGSNSDVRIRCPPCVTRMVQSFVKAKWCGSTVMTVLQREFFSSSSSDSSSPSNLLACFDHGLIRLNHASISASQACDVKLKPGDVLGRILHWHEPPVLTPHRIDVAKVLLPETVASEYGLQPFEAVLYVCNKPSSVPVHPAGPYLANTLTVMVEAQEGLESKVLLPIHRTDRATSGLTLLSDSSVVAKIFHKSLSSLQPGAVQKLYLAKVCGKFPSSPDDLQHLVPAKWHETTKSVYVDAPVHTPDPTSGVRIVSDEGKSAQSVFRLLCYDPSSDTSVVLCYPITGRNHQLRVHLQALKFPILGDVQYGGLCNADDGVPKQAVLETLNLCANSSAEDELRLEGMDNASVLVARKACPNCRACDEHHPSPFFTDAQLLQGGHAIHLHALRYRVSFFSNQKKNKSAPIASVEFSVEPPKWALSVLSLLKDNEEWKDIWQQHQQ